MKNPIEKILTENNLTMIELAKLANVGYSTVSNLKYGFTKGINPNLLTVFKKLGYDQNKVINEYKKFRKTESKNLIDEVK
ncbi:MAG: hypothetical protein ACOCRX_10655 [Candidatus Woesearchaeota archaeon]